MNARQARALVAAGILGYQIACKDSHRLRERVDQWLASRPILAGVAIAVAALHLGNALAKRHDVVLVGFRRADMWQVVASRRTHFDFFPTPQGPNAIA